MIKLRKTHKPGTCDAQRCTALVNAPATLCPKHVNEPIEASTQTVLEAGPEVDSLATTRTEYLSLLDTAANVPLDAVCESPVGQVTGLALLGQIREYARQGVKDLEAGRSAQKKPFIEGGREVDARYRPALDTAAALMRACDDRIRAYALSQDQARREALAEVSRLAAGRDGMSDAPLTVEEQRATQAAIQVAHERAQAAGPLLPPQVKFRTEFSFEVSDHSLIPREFLTLDVPKLLAHIRQTQGTSPVDGITIIRSEGVGTA